jgi:DNA-binding transcriptional MocR family regulator
VRQISRQKSLSVTTILQAYHLLEDRGAIEARPQSGYYVRVPLPPTPAPQPGLAELPFDPARVRIDDLVMRVVRDSHNPDLMQFGAALPSPELLPTAKLNRNLAKIARRTNQVLNTVGLPEGTPELRAQVARRAFLAGCSLAPDEIVITSGCTEALHLALRAVCKPGELVAVESPTYFGILQVLQSLSLRALEIPTHPDTGISLGALRFAIENHPVKAAVVMTNFNNPLGSCMPPENKRELVAMLAAAEIPLVEDDIYGELSFSGQHPGMAKTYDRKGLVLLTSSFTKDISPSYRIGWIAPGRFKDAVVRQKMATSLGTAILPQLAIAEFLESGSYDHHLRTIRRAYAQKVSQMAHAVVRAFPDGTLVTNPQGGFVLWVQLPGNVDSLELYRRAVQAGITLAPGYLFSATPRYRNYIRLTAAYWSFSAERALVRLGQLVGQMG